jgi:molecular chaperone DnaJ
VFLIRTESFPLMIVVLRWFIPILVVSASTSSNSRYREFSRPAKNAYQILQIDNRFPATQEDIKSQYRKLCLKYHPDKNTQKSDSERKVREQRFKEIQLAYENLKDPIHRREYDEKLEREKIHTYSNQYSESRGGTTPTAGFRQGEADPLFSSMHSTSNIFGNPYHSGSTTSNHSPSFYVNGVNINHIWDYIFPRQQLSSSCGMLYEQEITIPLQDLYAGKMRQTFILDTANLWKRYKAAYRGGLLSKVLVRGLAYFFLLVCKVRLPLAFALFVRYIHTNIPDAASVGIGATKISKSENNIQFVSSIKGGWKGGTRVTFQISPGSKVTFIIKEKVHDVYKRVGDDLYTNVTISISKALHGCEIIVPPLNKRKELPIKVRINPGQMNLGKRGEVYNRIVIKGKGWPKKDGTKGNLIVHLYVES